MTAQVTLHFHLPLTEVVQNKIISYIQMFPPLYWGKHVNVNRERDNGMLEIKDNSKSHLLYENELPQNYN